MHNLSALQVAKRQLSSGHGPHFVRRNDFAQNAIDSGGRQSLLAWNALHWNRLGGFLDRGLPSRRGLLRGRGLTCAPDAFPGAKKASDNQSPARAEPVTRRELREERASMPSAWENLRKEKGSHSS